MTVEELLADQAWLRRLARGLAGDAADDVVQETWIAAMRSPPSGERRPWLARVARNVARMGRRGDARRVLRETAAPAGAAPATPEELLERMELQHRLAAAVVALAEPVRTVILLRFVEGITSADIARRLGIPDGTVRWRLKEGLDRLRASLDDRDRRVLLGAFLMAKKKKSAVLLAALLLAAVAIVIGVWQWRAARSGDVASTSGPTHPAGGAGEPSAGVREPYAGVREPYAGVRSESAVVARGDAAAANGVFAGRVINWSTSRPVPRAELAFAGAGGLSAVRADEDGRFRFEAPAAGKYRLAIATAPDFLPYSPELEDSPVELVARPGRAVENLTIFLKPAIDYTGVVHAPDGRPAAGVQVRIVDAAEGEQALSPIADRFTSDDRGEFVFNAHDGAILEARHEKWGRARGYLDGKAQTSHRVELRFPPKPAQLLTITGRVVDDGGQPVPGATVTAADREHLVAIVKSDDDGAFVVDGLEAGEIDLVATLEGFPAAEQRKVAAGARNVVLEMRQGGVLVGRVRDAGGKPVPAFHVVVTRRRGIADVLAASRAFVDDEGEFRMEGIEPGAVQVQAVAQGLAPAAAVPATIALSGEATVELVVTRGGRLIGRVVEAEGGAPIPLARVTLEEGRPEGPAVAPLSRSAVTGDAGEFVLEGLPPGKRSVFVGAYAHHMRIVGIDVVDGATTGPITIDLVATKPGEEPKLEVAGIGAALEAIEDGARVVKLIPGGGAEAIGIVPGDVVISVDGALVTALGMDQTLQRIRGPAGTTVRIGLRRADGQTVELVVERRRIRS